MDTYESVLLVKSEVFVFSIPPRSLSRGYRAADWNLQDPTWTGRMRLVSQGNAVAIKLEDKITGELFAKCPIEKYPGIAVEPVTDSSRYFVLRVQNDNGRSAFLGIGFLDRSDSFDLNVALQDHFKWLKNQEQIEKEKDEPKQELDLRFKEGETIKINMKITVRSFNYFIDEGVLSMPRNKFLKTSYALADNSARTESASGTFLSNSCRETCKGTESTQWLEWTRRKKDGSEVSSKAKQRPTTGIGLPPPPGGVKIAPPPAKTPTSSPAHKPAQNQNQPNAEWGEFASASQQSQAQQQQQQPSTVGNSSWVQF